MNDSEFKRKNSDDQEVEEKIYKAGIQLYCSCVAYDVVSKATIGESLGASEEFLSFISALREAEERRKFTASEKALYRLSRH